jgi:3-deoxy-D-manno-octulosonic-acid transferase
LHNTLEAATFGKPILFGNKNYQKFDEAVALLNLGVAHSISTSAEALKLIKMYWENEQAYQQHSLNTSEFVKKSTGATKLIMSYIKDKKHLL